MHPLLRTWRPLKILQRFVQLFSGEKQHMATLLQEQLREEDLAHGDCDLSETGEKQIRFALKTTAAELQQVVPYLVLCSPLKRALRSALAAYPHSKIKVDVNLREHDCKAGMLGEDMKLFLDTVWPNRTPKIDLASVSKTKPWWSAEPESEAAFEQRVQKALGEIKKAAEKGKIVVVAHGVLFRKMCETKPFPSEWGTLRIFPSNFKPYPAKIIEDCERVNDQEQPQAGKLQGKKSAILKVCPEKVDEATVVLLRHAHSRAQEANSLKRRIDKFEAAPEEKKPKLAKSIDAAIRRFKAP